MANAAYEGMFDLSPNYPTIELTTPIQDNENCYQGRWVTYDSSMNIGEYLTTERLAGMCKETRKNTDESHEAARPGYDVPVIVAGVIRLAISGAVVGDIGRAVFTGADNQTVGFTPYSMKFVGNVINYDRRNAVVEVLMRANAIGGSVWDTHMTLADDAILTLPTEPGTYTLRVGNDYAIFAVGAAGAVDITDSSANIDPADTDNKFCVYDGGAAAVLKNRLGSSQKFQLSFKGSL